MLRDLSRSFREGTKRHVVLDGVSATFRRGESVALRGRSGSGKSTLLNLISGIDTPDRGTVEIDGRDVTAMSEKERTLYRREHVGFVYQAFNLVPTLTVADNVRLVLELNGVDARESDDRIAALLDAVGLGERANAHPDVLSGGEQQRVAIARALAHQPTLILADEPTGNLDEKTADAVLGLLDRLVRRQGGTMLVETFAQYSALMVMEKEYGPHLMRRFLKYELDNYLTNRGNETIEELPLYKVENQQHIHYRKGSVVMYALKDYLGEDLVNRSLARLIEEKAYDYQPYTTSLDYLRILREEAGPEHEELIADLFERIVLFDLKAERAEIEPMADGTYKVTLDYTASKLEADGQGEETERDLDMMIDIGVFTKSPDDEDFGEESVLHLTKHRITSGEGTIELIVDEEPSHVGIDPYNKLIDRDSNDNLRTIDEIRVATAD